MLLTIFRTFHNLSLNVVFGAMLNYWMFCRLPTGKVQFDVYSAVLLGIATWVIYLGDRLLDLRIYPVDFSRRHQFHHDHRQVLIVLLVFLIVIGIVLCFFVPRKVVYFGFGLSGFIGIYFFLLNTYLKKDRFQWLKEPITTICYAWGIVGLAFIALPNIYLSSWILAFLFFFVVAQNLLVFSYFESLLIPSSKNAISYLGQKQGNKIIRWLSISVLFLVISFFSTEWNYNTQVAFLLLLMSLVLSFMPAKAAYFLQDEKYRWIGDGVFFLPLLLI